MAEVRIKALPCDTDEYPSLITGLHESVLPWVVGDRIFFSLIRNDKGMVLGVWYPCLGDWDRTPEGSIAR